MSKKNTYISTSYTVINVLLILIISTMWPYMIYDKPLTPCMTRVIVSHIYIYIYSRLHILQCIHNQKQNTDCRDNIYSYGMLWPYLTIQYICILYIYIHTTEQKTMCIYIYFCI